GLPVLSGISFLGSRVLDAKITAALCMLPESRSLLESLLSEAAQCTDSPSLRDRAVFLSRVLAADAVDKVAKRDALDLTLIESADVDYFVRNLSSLASVLHTRIELKETI